jgi:hypothetical protein
MMAMKLNPDSVLGLAGIGPKSMETIKTALENISFPEPEPTVEPVAEIPVEEVAEALVETVIVTAPVEVLPEPVIAEGEPPAVAAEITEEKDKEKPIEEIFTLRPDMLQPVAVVAEDDDDEADKKKDKKKKKKVVEIVFDEVLEKSIALKKHKRGDEGWEEE